MGRLPPETLILMAIPIESQRLFENSNANLVYTGIGKINAAMVAAEAILKREPQFILNLGTAGSHKLPTHSLVECIGFVDRDVDLSSVGVPRGIIPKDLMGGMLQPEDLFGLDVQGICGSGDHLEIGQPKMECDLMDMEAYAIAKVCKSKNIRFASVKYITDGSDKNLKQDWFANIKLAAQGLFNFYQRVRS